MTNKELADLIYPNITKTIEDYEKQYPKRDLPETAIVTRYAPSPTGFIHLGAMYASFNGKIQAEQSNGVLFLRIEDTDTKRTIDNGINEIIDGLNEYNITFDEGPLGENNSSIGNYGPYIQSERKEIYQTFVKYLIEQGLAYPCFCSTEELNDMREKQDKRKDRLGYYGEYAVCRNLNNDQIAEKIKKGEQYSIRLKSPGDYSRKVVCQDVIRGKLVFPENDIDIVINKTDGLPTYHFAHLVDDHLMRTTHAIRSDEWVASLPVHYQLFQVFGFEIPKYAHIAPLAKIDNGSLRKLSKRKDPELAMSFYHQEGIPYEALKIYLATIADSGFEVWYNSHSDAQVSDYTFKLERMSKSPAVFDLDKLNFICKEYISKLKASDLYELVKTHLNQYDKEFAKLFTKNPDYSIAYLNIEREQKKPRKDITKYSDVKNEMCFMFDELFEGKWDENNIDYNILKEYVRDYYNAEDTQQEWFDRIAEFGAKHGYVSTKEYKANPDAYVGSVGDICEMLRYIVTARHQTPNLYDILKLIDKDRILARISLYETSLNNKDCEN